MIDLYFTFLICWIWNNKDIGICIGKNNQSTTFFHNHCVYNISSESISGNREIDALTRLARRGETSMNEIMSSYNTLNRFILNTLE